MKSNKLIAVHDDDLESTLIKLGILGDFKAGKIKCAFCKELITWENLHSIFPDSGAIKCCCTNPLCVNQLIAKRRSAKDG